MTFYLRLFALSMCFAVITPQAITAQEVARYRDFVLGSDLAAVAKLAGAATSSAKVIHARPNMMQDLEWRPRYYSGGNSPLTDPVDTLLFKFYDDQLFTIVADYDRRRTEGDGRRDALTRDWQRRRPRAVRVSRRTDVRGQGCRGRHGGAPVHAPRPGGPAAC